MDIAPGMFALIVVLCVLAHRVFRWYEPIVVEAV